MAIQYSKYTGPMPKVGGAIQQLPGLISGGTQGVIQPSTQKARYVPGAAEIAGAGLWAAGEVGKGLGNVAQFAGQVSDTFNPVTYISSALGKPINMAQSITKPIQQFTQDTAKSMEKEATDRMGQGAGSIGQMAGQGLGTVANIVGGAAAGSSIGSSIGAGVQSTKLGASISKTLGSIPKIGDTVSKAIPFLAESLGATQGVTATTEGRLASGQELATGAAIDIAFAGLPTLLKPILKKTKKIAAKTGDDLLSKVIKSTKKQRNTGLDLAAELKKQGWQGNYNQLRKAASDLYENSMRAKKDLLKKSTGTVAKKEIVKILDDAAKNAPVELGNKKAFDNLIKRIKSDLDNFAPGQTQLSLSKAEDLKKGLGSAKQSAWGREGNQGAELYKDMTRRIKGLIDAADDTKKISKIRQDIRVGKASKDFFREAAEKAAEKSILRFSDLTLGSGAGIAGSVIGGAPGAVIGATGSAVLTRVLGSATFKTKLANILFKLAEEGASQSAAKTAISNAIIKELSRYAALQVQQPDKSKLTLPGLSQLPQL